MQQFATALCNSLQQRCAVKQFATVLCNSLQQCCAVKQFATVLCNSLKQSCATVCNSAVLCKSLQQYCAVEQFETVLCNSLKNCFTVQQFETLFYCATVMCCAIVCYLGSHPSRLASKVSFINCNYLSNTIQLTLLYCLTLHFLPIKIATYDQVLGVFV